METETLLRDLGLTEGEIRVYLALFRLGATSVGPLAQESKVTQSKVYPILDKLISKGLASHVVANGVKTFSATHPSSLVEYVENKIHDLEERKDSIQKLLPQLLAKHQEIRQTSRVFEGFRGIKALFAELFDKKGEILVLGVNEHIADPGMAGFFKWYHDLRKKQGISLKLILNRSIKEAHQKSYVKCGMYGKKDEIRYVDAVFPIGVFIFKEHVVNVISGSPPTAFDTISTQNAQHYRRYFEALWKEGKG